MPFPVLLENIPNLLLTRILLSCYLFYREKHYIIEKRFLL